MTLRKAAARRLYSPAEERTQNKLPKPVGALLGRAELSYAYCVNYHFFFFAFVSSGSLGPCSRPSFLRYGVRVARGHSGQCAISSPAGRLPCAALAPSRRRSSASSRSRRWRGPLPRSRLARIALLPCRASGLLLGLSRSNPCSLGALRWRRH